jgi:hypothetical protein
MYPIKKLVTVRNLLIFFGIGAGIILLASKGLTEFTGKIVIFIMVWITVATFLILSRIKSN